ncbi:MAG TPA: hypothetical protein IAB31_10120 [Candidatus Choladousia intestinavium]|uniref:Uncharacterized protein n=1 Tax=Candidatus Choladousia intestinavium TaxID=2840727 RepID=A0A9D1DA95_9FIRM|nr:hypothetical protein [Candidatus Choladousia intestinavium]
MKQSKYTAGIIQLLAVAVLAGLSVYTALNTGILSNLGQEEIYWERARFLLGQGGASNYNGSSLCSLGYSLVLVPICAILKSPYAAYKAAILLNGGFLCLGYLLSVKTARKLFAEEKTVFLSAACFFASLCPALAASRSFTGPEMLLALLVWLSLYLLLSIKENCTSGKLAGLAACMILGGFLQIAFLGVILAAVILLGIYVKKKRVAETSFLYFCLAVLLGLALGNIAERVFLYSFAKDMDITVTSSLELFLDSLMTGWENNYLLGVFRGLCGKLYALLAGSFLLLAPGLWHCIKGLFPGRDTKAARKRQIFCPEVFLFFALELLVIVLYDNSRSTAVALISVNYVEVALPPMLLLGAVQIRRTACWVKELTGYLLTLCVCALVTANLYQTQGITSISSTNNGILMLFQDWGMTPVAVIYGSACLVILAAILVCFCVKSSLKRKWMNRAFRAVGFLGSAGCFLVFGLLVCRHTAVHANESNTRNIAPIASVISETKTQGDYHYLMGTGSDQNLSILQSLAPEQWIQMEKNNGKERAEFYEEVRSGEKSADVIITGTGESLIEETMPDELPDYRLIYMTTSYAIWARRGSEKEQSLEETVSGRLQYLELRSVSELQAELPSDEEVEQENQDAEAATEAAAEDQEEELPGNDSQNQVDGAIGDELSAEEETEADAEEGAEADGLAGEDAEEAEADGIIGEDAEEAEADGILGENAEADAEEAAEEETEEAAETENQSEENGSALSSQRKTYGGRTYLAPGTYRIEIYFRRLDSEEGLTGQIRLSDSNGTIITEKTDDGIFDAGDTGAVVVEFTNRDVMRNFRVVISGTLAGHTEVTDIYYWKTSSAYTVGLNGNNGTDAPCEAIQEVEALCENQGTVAYVGDVMTDSSDLSTRCFEAGLPGYTVEVISKEESESTEATYLIGPTASHSYYYAMEDYSVIDKTRFYTVLVRNDSEQYEKFTENGGTILSEGRELLAAAFTDEETASGPIALDAGSYIFRGEIQDQAGTGAVVQVKNGEEILAEQELSGRTVEIPFALPERCIQLSCTVRTEDGETLDVTDWSIELTSEKYQFGQEEEELDSLLDIINDLGQGVTVAAVQELDKIKEEDTQYDYLQEQLPDAEVEVRSFTEANNAADDPLLLTCGLSENYLRLLGKYCILGHAGQYTLWARCEGENVQKAMENGVEILSSAKKISPASLMAVTGTENETEAIAELPEAVYNVYLEVDVSDLEKDDTIEFMLLCDKTEEEIEDEIQELEDTGYTRREAEEEVEEQVVCGSATYEAYGLDGENEMVYAIRTNQSRQLLNLTVDAYTWTANAVESEIIWVEIV